MNPPGAVDWRRHAVELSDRRWRVHPGGPHSCRPSHRHASGGRLKTHPTAVESLVQAQYGALMSIPVQPVPPEPGQESVWDYPRPPRVEASPRHIQVIADGHSLADTRRALRVLETSQAPVYYIPLVDIDPHCLAPSRQVTLCEWKGHASYFA